MRADLDALAQADARLGSQLRTTAALDRIRDQWSALDGKPLDIDSLVAVEGQVASILDTLRRSYDTAADGSKDLENAVNQTITAHGG